MGGVCTATLRPWARRGEEDVQLEESLREGSHESDHILSCPRTTSSSLRHLKSKGSHFLSSLTNRGTFLYYS